MIGVNASQLRVEYKSSGSMLIHLSVDPKANQAVFGVCATKGVGGTLSQKHFISMAIKVTLPRAGPTLSLSAACALPLSFV